VALAAVLIAVAAAGPGLAAAEQQTTVSEDSFPLYPYPQQVITGETTLDPGTEIAVEIVSRDSSSPFVYKRDVKVQPNGTFVAQFDLDDVPANTSYTLSAYDDGDKLYERNGTVEECESNCTDATAAAEPGVAAKQQTTISEDSFPLYPYPQQVITGETTLDPGTEIAVEIVSRDSSSPFVYKRDAKVQSNGTFAAQFDMSRVSANTSYKLSAYDDGDKLYERNGTVEECESNCTDATAAAEPGVAAKQQATVSEDSFPLYPYPQQVITGETTLESGTEMTVRLVSEDASSPFLKQREVRVQPNGTFVAQFDMSKVPANTSYELSAHADGDTLFERIGTVEQCDSNCTDPVPDIKTPTETDSDEKVVTVSQGGTAEIPVSMTDGRNKTLSVGSEAVNYQINATVTDGDDDGEVLVLFDTAAAGTDAETLSVADDGDSLTVTTTEPTLSSTLDPAAYTYRVFDSRETDDTPTTGTLLIEANETANEEFEVEETAEFGFEESVSRVQQGDTGRIPIVLTTADAATISIGSPASNYEINATVRDGNDDDRVVLLFDTTAAGHDEPTLETAADADAVAVESGSEVALDSQLAAGSYELSLYRGTDVASQPDAIGTLMITDGTNSTADASSDGVDSVTGETPAAQQSQDAGLGISAGALVVGAILAIAGVGICLRSIMN
jgi:uncharacterized lipoprotein YbaY